MSLSDQCFIGTIEQIGGIDCYVATPTGLYGRDKCVLFLTDIFGLALQNNRLLGDDFARNGYKTVIPDLFSGDPIPVQPPPDFNRESWNANHGPAQVRPVIDTVIAALKEQGITELAGAGFCFGARYVFDLSFENQLKVSIVSHPSRLVIPDDLNKYLSDSKSPLLINSCEVDNPFPIAAQAQADEILATDSRRRSSGFGAADLTKALSAHFNKFGTVKSVDGLGALDGVGQPRKFGYITVEGAEASITKCVNSLSGSTWKGVKVRVGDAKPDYAERIAAENADAPPPTRKRKRAHTGEHASDMSLVTPENAAQRSGWKVTETGRILRAARMRPDRPLPPPLDKEAAKRQKTEGKERKRKRDPDTRARRRTIDVTRWGNTQLKGVFLENVSSVPRREARVVDQRRAPPPPPKRTPISKPAAKPVADAPKPVVDTLSKSISTTPKIVPSPKPVSAVANEDDFAAEKTTTLQFLNSLFGDADANSNWGGRESVGSDIDEEELLAVGAAAALEEDAMDDIEVVARDVDVPQEDEEMMEEDALAAAEQSVPQKETRETKIRDLFAPRGDAGFSILGHLDLDLDEDTEFSAPVSIPIAEHSHIPSALNLVPTTANAHTPITLDAKQPLFFPLPSSFASGPLKARQRDILDVAKDNDWPAHFCKTETDEEIRAKWEVEKVELTRDWTRRWKEAGKMQRRRRGGPDGE
ncbi:hypothetical protein MKEN_00171900 [Mycena kentingensis (nom. inval.)]|nr:hypothetical protein MKEN_00171900 [Mycena kentingensis (nom. inval.)]